MPPHYQDGKITLPSCDTTAPGAKKSALPGKGACADFRRRSQLP